MKYRGLFRFLLVLSILWSGMAALWSLSMAATLPQMQRILADNPGLLPEEAFTMMQTMLDLPRFYYLVTGILYLLELGGVVLMWNLRWSGFHTYTLARLLLLLMPLLFLGRGYVGFGDVMFALLYVLSYFLMMKSLTISVDSTDHGSDPDSDDSDNPTRQ